jgi:glycogen debranching enzyme
MSSDAAKLAQRTLEARQILVGNSRGGYTVPSPKLYPFQWNWDSAITALGWAEFDIDRAFCEVEKLFDAQWASGMVPHIVFWSDESTYFPGPDVWKTDAVVGSPELAQTSGISQPPLAATVVRQLSTHDQARAVALVPKLDAWHRWWHAARDPSGLGAIAVSHPWESGRDNSPDWDAALSEVAIDAAATYARRDLDLIDADMRPHQSDYDRYVALVEFGAESDWDDDVISQHNPFWVADPATSAILLRAERDLAALMMMTGSDTSAVDERVARLERGYEQFWNLNAGAYCALDLRSGRHADAATSASFLAPYAGVTAHHDQVVALLDDWAQATPYAVPSVDPLSPLFEPKRYWRGPIWLVINYMIGVGLAEAGDVDRAERVRASSRDLIVKSGFAESFNAIDGDAVGGEHFSWTAAIWLTWASPQKD